MNPLKGLRKMGCLGSLLLGLAIVIGALVIVTEIDSESTGPTAPVGTVTGIPPRMMTAYAGAAAKIPGMVPACKGLTWAVLAGIAQVESTQAQGHTVGDDGVITPPIIGPRLDGSGAGGNTTAVLDTDRGKWDGDTQYDHAVGPFQFLPATFAGYAARVRPDGGASPNNVDDEALAAGLYLCGNGRDLTDRSQLSSAIYQYNASQAYVNEVETWIDQFSLLANTGPIGDASEQAQKVIAAARSQIGIPYSWGGGAPSGPTTGQCCSEGGQDGRTVTGFDCSGLMLYAFSQVGISLPRVAKDQAEVGQRIPASDGLSALQPGDMVFFGPSPTNDSQIFHVGLYIGGGQMIAAPKPGDHVKQQAVWDYDYAGGARVLK